MVDIKPNSVCLICLKRFGGETSAVQNGNSNNGATPPAPQSSLSTLESYLRMKQNTRSLVSVDSENQRCSSADLYSRFLHLTGRYLKVSVSEAFLTLAKEHERKTGKSVEVFCQHCQVFVENICDLYGELQVINLKLLGKVEKLESVTRQSVKTVSSKLVRILFKALADQLNVKAVTRLELFRKNIILSCCRKVKESPPQVVVPRGLLPQQWAFTYSAAKLVLMRLIIIFALAAAPPRSQEKIFEETEGGTISVGNDDNAHHFKKIKSKREAAYSQNKNVEGIKEEDDRFDTDDFDHGTLGNVPDIGGGDENESDWSVGTASLADSSDSPAESEASYITQHDDQKIPVTQHKPPKKSRTQRLALGLVQVICEEDDDTATDNPQFQQMIEKQLKQIPSINPEDPDLVCKLCKHAYPNTWRLGLHLKSVHSIVNPYHCSTCALEFKATYELTTHRRAMHPQDYNKRLTCPKCPDAQPFATNTALTKHLKSVHRMALACKLCDYKSMSYDDLQRHNTKMHTTIGHKKTAAAAARYRRLKGQPREAKEGAKRKSESLQRCPHCPQRRFSMPATLASHMRFAHHFCTLCDYKANDQQQLLLHRVNVHMKKNAREKDKDKKSGTPVATGLLAAAAGLRKSKVDDRIKLPTTQTRAHSNLPQSLKQRLEAVDSIDTEMYTGVPCQVCNSLFESGPSLRAHLNMEHEQVPDVEKTISCAICCLKFAQEQTYELHYLVQHLRAYPFICDVASCYAHFLNRSDLNAHLEAVHLEDPGNEQRSTETVDSLTVKSISYCPTCNSGFASPYELQLHQLTHKLENNFPHYPCPACEEQRCSIVGVVAHYNTAHGNNLKLFKCLECHEKFFNQDTQRHHIRNHNTGKILKLTMERKEKARQKQEAAKLKKENQISISKMPESLKSRIMAKDPDRKTDSELYTGVPCQVCSAVFESGPLLRAHLNKEHEQVPDNEEAITCSICCSKFAHEQTYELHYLVQHLGAYKFVCDAESCQEHFLNREELNAHLENVHLKKPGEDDQSQSTTTQQVERVESISYCVICNWGFVNPYFFKLHELVHVIRQRFDKNGYLCPACPLKKASVPVVLGHYNTTHGKKMPNWKCLECPKKYFYQESLQLHIKNVNRGSILEAGVERGAESGFVCSECGEPYSDVAKLRWHILKEHNASAGYFVCPEKGCERAYADKEKFRVHCTACRHRHSGNRLVCQEAECGRTFKCRSGLRRHRKKQHDGLRNHEKEHKSGSEEKMRPGNKFVCTEGGCGLEFKNKYGFHRHQRKHRASKYVQCPEEGCRQTIVKRKLHVHRERVHANRDFCTLCSICGMSFRDENTRRKHERWVHPPPQFECDICHKKYKRKNALKQHKRVHNPDPQTYTVICQECGSTFKTAAGLRLHLNSKHTPEENKKFACSHCQYRTHRPLLLKSHMRTCLKKLGLPWDEEKYGKLPASLTKYTGPPRKSGRKPGWNKRKRDDQDDDEEEMEDKSTTENDSGEEEEKTESASIGASCQKPENASTTSQVDHNIHNQQQQHENQVYSQSVLNHIYYPGL